MAKRALRRAAYFVKGLWRSRRSESELDEELRFHLEMEVENNRGAGMDEAEAWRRAKVSFGGVEQAKVSCRRAYGGSYLRDLAGDCVFSFRYLAKRKGLALSILLTLSVCIGTNLAFFAALEKLVLRPLPLRQPGQLVEIFRSDLQSGGSKLGGNLALLQEYEKQTDLFQSTAYFSGRWMNLNAGGEGFRVHALHVSDGFFNVIGSQPAQGVLNDVEAAGDAVVLSHSLWERLYSRAESLLGKTLLLDGQPKTVVGVAPPESESVAEDVGIFVLPGWGGQRLENPQDEAQRSANEGTIWARLRPGTTSEDVSHRLAELESVFTRSASSWYREANGPKHRRIEVSPVQYERTKWARSRLYALNGTALLVLVIGGVNVSNLLLAQSLSRKHEFWIRRTIGASRGRLARQCFTEVLLLCLAGWVISIAIGFAGIQLLNSFSSELFQSSAEIGFGFSSIAYSLGLTLASAAILGTVVAWRSLLETRKAGSNRSPSQSTSDRSATALQSALSVGQTALTLALLIAAGLLAKSFYRVTTQDVGFEDRGIVTARFHLPSPAYEDSADREQFTARLLQALRAKPGVSHASLSSTIPTFGYPDNIVTKIGAEGAEGSTAKRSYFSYITPGYLDTMGISLLEGRHFNGLDSFGWQTPIVVDERFAHIHYPGGSALGRRLRLGGAPNNPQNWWVIVGVVETSRHTTIEGDGQLPLVYLPLRDSWIREYSIFMKSSLSPEQALALLRSELGKLDGSLPVFRFGEMSSIVAESLKARKGLLVLSLAMGCIALALAAVGMYGNAAFRVTQRLRELAIRMAVGASEAMLVRSIVRYDLRLAMLGLLLGSSLALASVRVLSSALYGIESFDWQICAGVALLVLMVSCVSSYTPARRAIRKRRIRL